MALGGAEFTPVAICGREEGELCIMPEKVLVLWSDSEVCRGLEVVVVMMVVGVECAGVELMAGRTGAGSAEVLMDLGWGMGVLSLVSESTVGSGSFNCSLMSGASLAEESIFCRLVTGGIPPGSLIMDDQLCGQSLLGRKSRLDSFTNPDFQRGRFGYVVDIRSFNSLSIVDHF